MFTKNKLLRLAVCMILAAALMIPMCGVALAGPTDGEEGEGACTSFYMGKGTTENGSYIWGRSEDISAGYTKLFDVHEAEEHEPGEMYISGTWNASYTTFTPGFKWPYPEKTLRYILCKDSIYNERLAPEPYAEVGMNEKGVSISSTVTISSTKSAITSLDASVSRSNGGLAEIDVASVVLMQAETARGACELVAKVIDTVGASGREGFMVSDPNEVWFFQWLTGHQYVAVKCPDDKIGYSPNITGNVGDKDGYVDITDTENVIASPGLISVPKAAGVLVANEDETKIKIADTYARDPANHQSGRMRVGYGYLYGYTTNDEIAANLPGTQYLDYFVEPRQDRKYSLYEALRLLGNRGEGTEWEVANPTGNGSSIGNAGTVEAHVFEVRPNMPFELATVEWICLAPAEFNVYLPYYGNLVTKVFEKCYSPDPNPRAYDNANPDNNSLYWVFRELYAQCTATTIAERERLGNGVRAFWERYQKELIAQQATVDAAMKAVLVTGGRAAAEEKATEISMKLTEETYEYAKTILAELKAFKAAGTEGNFIPSLLADDGAVPCYSKCIAPVKTEILLSSHVQILEGHAANIPIQVETAGLAPDKPIVITITDKTGETVYGTVTADENGYALIQADAFPGADTYLVKITCGDDISVLALDVVKYDLNIWDAALSAAADGVNTMIMFNKAPVAKNGTFDNCVTINGGTSLSGLSVDGNALLLPYAYDQLKTGDTIVVSGVKFPQLFPSYSFTFTVHVTK